MQFIEKLSPFSGNRFLYLNCIVSLIYVGIALPFYTLPYEVPDYFKYYGFALENLPARDGFSSLFILISSQLIDFYRFVHFAMLFCMAFSLWLINLAFSQVSQYPLNRFLFIAFTYSVGCWYYFYGKVFYEFPFIALTFALMLWIVSPFWVKVEPN